MEWQWKPKSQISLMAHKNSLFLGQGKIQSTCYNSSEIYNPLDGETSDKVLN